MRLQAALLRLSSEVAQIFPFYPLSERKHFFLIFTEYFLGAMDYFAACSDVRVKRTGCRPLIDKKGDAHVHLLEIILSSESLHLSAHLQSP